MSFHLAPELDPFIMFPNFLNGICTQFQILWVIERWLHILLLP